MTSELVGIGAVITEMSEEFPDLSVSKVRFLEAQGLLNPVRTPSGYRRYSRGDRDRLRYILRTQRDHFLPLKVIAEHLDAMSRGLEPPAVSDPTPRPPELAPPAEDGPQGVPDRGREVRLSEEELRRESGLTVGQLAEAVEQGLLTPGPDGRFGMTELSAAAAVAGLAEYGVGARHLRAVRLAAERHTGIVDQLVLAAHRDVAAQRQMATRALALTKQLEASILAAHVDRSYPI